MGLIVTLALILWAFITVFLLSFWFWTNYIVLQQKKAWKAYAQKRKLRYSSNKFYDSPTMSGVIDGYKVSFFASEHSELDERSQRKLTAIEINLQSVLSVTAAVASGGMTHIVETLDMNHEYKPDTKHWDDSYIIRTRNIPYIKAYLNEGRIEKLSDLMGIEKSWVILLFTEGDTALLRLDTPLPLLHPKEIDRIVRMMVDVARILELNAGEENYLKQATANTPRQQKSLDIDEDLLSDDVGLELEEEFETEVDTDVKKDSSAPQSKENKTSS